MPDPPAGYSAGNYSPTSFINYPDPDKAWRVDTNTATARAVSQAMMWSNPGEYPDTFHEYSQGSPTIITGNNLNFPAIQYTPQWSTPTFAQLTEAVHNSQTGFENTNPEERIAYENAAGALIAARAEQDYAGIAFGSLSHIGANYNPNIPISKQASDTSVDAAFNVAQAAGRFEAERNKLAAIHSRRGESQAQAASLKRQHHQSTRPPVDIPRATLPTGSKNVADNIRHHFSRCVPYLHTSGRSGHYREDATHST